MLTRLLRALLPALCLLASAAAQAQVARVTGAKGTVLAERAGSVPRILGPGERLGGQDVISVARDSHAVIEFSDRTRVSLRPGTVFRIDTYREGAPESMLLGLLRGGLRAVTGLIGKHNPAAVKFQMSTATIGIRGTEFDARLCEDDCAREERMRPAPFVGIAVARVVEMKGRAAAARAGGNARMLAPGSSIYERDGIATGAGSHVVLVFGDGSRISLAERSRLAVNRYEYRETAPRAGKAYLTLLAGNAQVWTGQLAKISPDAFLFESVMGIIRPHGTGFSVGGCIGNACGSASVNVGSDGASASGSASVGSEGVSGTASTSSSGGTTATATVTTSGELQAVPLKTPEELAAEAEAMKQQLGQKLTEGQVKVEQAGEKNAANPSAPMPGVGAVPLPMLNPPPADIQGNVQEGADSAAQTGRNIMGGADTGVDRVGEATATWVGQTASEAKAAADKVVGPTAEWVGQTAGDAKDGAGQVGANVVQWTSEKAAEAKGQGEKARGDVSRWTGENVVAPVADAAGNTQPENVLRAIEEIKSVEREFARQVADLQRALDDAKNLSDAEKQHVRDALAEWSRRVGEEVARKTAEVMSNPNAQVALTSLKIMGVIVATVAVTIAAGAVAIPLVLLSLVAHTAMTNPSVFEDVPASVIANATQGGEQAAQAMRSIVAAMVEHGKIGADEARQFTAIRDALDAAAKKFDVGKANDTQQDNYRRAAGESSLGAIMREVLSNLGGGSDQSRGPSQENAAPPSSADQRSPSVSVWDGSVEVAGQVVNKGESLRATADGKLVLDKRGASAVNGAPRPDQVSVDPELFGGGTQPVEPGLYVWVRDGVITLNRDGQLVEVAAGHAALATEDRMILLDYVPNFMRFDATPLPSDAGTDVPDAFRAPDGSAIGMCTVR